MAEYNDLPPPRERPWLLPYNRKIRHLQGITIRNLTLAASTTRSRGKTIDDEALPSTLKSPTKALAMRESKALAHSRSSSDLKATKEEPSEGNDTIGEPTTPTKPKRPGFGKGLRRRTTMEWANASPMTRQKKLEDITAVRMADTFFTLHADGQDEPIYISEIAEKAMNPNFKFFDLGPCGPGITRQDRLTVRVWAKSETMSDWQYLMDYSVHFRSLQFIGKRLGNFRHPLPQNCVLFHMTDGIYTSFIDLPVSEQTRREVLAPPKQNPDGRVLGTSSYDALMRLSTLDDCIQDAIVTRDRIADEIESILEANRESIHKIEEVPETEDNLHTLEAAVEAERRRVKAIRRKKDDLQATIQMRRDKIHGGMTLQSNLNDSLPDDRAQHKEMGELVDKLEEDIIGQRRRVCEDLVKLYPIEPVPGKSLSFTIRGLHLPNSEFDDVKEDETAAALSYVGQVVSQLCPYLSVVLPYPISLLGSITTIEDPLAVGHNNQNNPRTYPLYMKGVVRYRFEYGVFLLNKNIEILSNALGLRPMDVRQTLPNLKYLLYVATAGKGELPARKAGGIRGLLRHDGFGSRKSSMDSTATASSFGSPTLDFKKGLDSVGTKGSTPPKSNGSLVSAMSSLKQNAHAGSRLRQVE